MPWPYSELCDPIQVQRLWESMYHDALHHYRELFAYDLSRNILLNDECIPGAIAGVWDNTITVNKSIPHAEMLFVQQVHHHHHLLSYSFFSNIPFFPFKRFKHRRAHMNFPSLL